MTPSNTFHPLVKFMHMVMTLAILSAIGIILYADELPKGAERNELFFWHKSLGLLLAGLIVVRIMMVMACGKPEPVGKGLQKLAAVWVHRLLYVAMLVMPASGIIMSYAGGRAIPFFGLFTIPGAEEKMASLGKLAHEVHELGGNMIIALIVIHVLAALYHHFVLKDGTLARMFGRVPKETTEEQE